LNLFHMTIFTLDPMAMQTAKDRASYIQSRKSIQRKGNATIHGSAS